MIDPGDDERKMIRVNKELSVWYDTGVIHYSYNCK